MADLRMLLNKEIGKKQNHESFSVKPFYDMVHLSSYVKLTYVKVNVSSSSPNDDGVKGATTPPSSASPSAYRRDDINSVHGDGRSFEITIAKSFANYLFALRLPHRVGILLPSSNIMATFIRNGESCKVNFFGKHKIKMFGSGWWQFVEAHNLVEGDRLKFKIKENSDRKLKLKINILKCTVSSRPHEERRGTIECPVDVFTYDEEVDV